MEASLIIVILGILVATYTATNKNSGAFLGELFGDKDKLRSYGIMGGLAIILLIVMALAGMGSSQMIMAIGFVLAAYSVVGNDVIQTLGTFLTSNEKQPWYILWAFAGSILTAVLVYGWMQGDIAYDRLDKVTIPTQLSWWFVLPPLILMFLTRFGIPVSTTFLIITFFSSKDLMGMVQKSGMGYVIAFIAAGAIYLAITKLTEKKFIELPIDKPGDNSLWTNRTFWTVAQWSATAFLWSQWLTQDLANIYIYLLQKEPGGGLSNLGAGPFIFSLVVLLGLLGFIFYQKGGAIQEIVKSKTNTADIRSATFVDLMYGVVLYLFKYNALGLWEAKLPMSTTWVFIGLLAGREIAIRFRLQSNEGNPVFKNIALDFGKVMLGLGVSVALVKLMQVAAGIG